MPPSGQNDLEQGVCCLWFDGVDEEEIVQRVRAALAEYADGTERVPAA
jgi:hypothetical protein